MIPVEVTSTTLRLHRDDIQMVKESKTFIDDSTTESKQKCG